MKTCPRCSTEKSPEDFSKNRRRRDGRSVWCRSCTKTYRAERAERYRPADRERYLSRRQAVERERRYGVDPATYERLLAEQGGACAICRAEPAGEALCVDHDHETGAVRGLLCRRCNSGLGHLRDDVSLVRSALDYLERGTP